jgi:hypothetical protein
MIEGWLESQEEGGGTRIESQMLYVLSFLMHLPGTVNRKKCGDRQSVKRDLPKGWPCL